MNFAKKLTAALLLVIIVLSVVPRVARAATFSVSLSQEAFSDAGYTDVHISVNNDSVYSMTQIRIECAGKSYSVPMDIAPYSPQSFDINNFYVSEGMIGKNVDFTFYWTENGEQKQKTQSVYIARADANTPTPPSFDIPLEDVISFECYSNNPQAESGQTVDVKYEVSNGSVYDMTNITITDSGLSTSPVVSGKDIAAGKSATFTFKYTMGDENATTNPILSYQVNGKWNSKQGNSITLECVTVNLNVTVTKLEANNKGTEFKIKIENSGNKRVSSVRIFTGDGEQLEHSFDIEAYSERELSYTFNPKGKMVLSFLVTAKLATGEEYKFESETYTIWEYIDPNAVAMEFEVKVTGKLDEKGLVDLDFTAKNIGTSDMKNIYVEEDISGKIVSFSDLAGGGSETQAVTLFVGDARELNFKLVAYAPTGQPIEYTQKLSATQISTQEIVENAGGFDVNSIDVGGAISKLLKKLLTIFAVISAVSGVALITLTVFEVQRAAAMKKQDGEEK